MARGLKETVRARLEAGETISKEDFPNVSAHYLGSVLSNLGSTKYCGQGRVPLRIVRENKTWRLWTPADGE